jgi:hypothetical protein
VFFGSRFDSPWERHTAYALISNSYWSSVFNREIPHASDFSRHCSAFAGGIDRDSQFARDSPTTSRKKFVFARSLRCDM